MLYIYICSKKETAAQQFSSIFLISYIYNLISPVAVYKPAGCQIRLSGTFPLVEFHQSND